MDEEAENVDDPYMILSPVAMSETRKKENFSKISTLTRKAFDGMDVVDRNQEGETDWTYWIYLQRTSNYF